MDKDRRGLAWHGWARRGKARDKDGLGKARHGLAGRGRARQGEDQGVARRGKARRGKARNMGNKEKTNQLIKKENIMATRLYEVTLKGESPLLMHQDNVQWSDYIKKYINDPANKGKSTAGDDRTPARTWIGALYIDNGRVVLPSDNLMTFLREGGSKVTYKGAKTFKAQTQSGVIVNQSGWDIIVDGKSIPYAPIKELIEEDDFEIHQQVVESLGFELFVKRAAINKSKHIRVRPRFNNWSCSGTMTVFDDTITTAVLTTILTQAGVNCGLCDWRPSSKTPGAFGRCTATVKLVK